MKENARLYLTLTFATIFIVALYILIYLSQINNDYLYFRNSKVDVNLGESFSLNELGLNSNIDFEDLHIECDGANYNEGFVCFDRAGNAKVCAESGNLKATLQVNVDFDSINEYFDIYANVDNSKITLTGDSVIELYLPSEDSAKATNDGYISSFNISVNSLKQEDDFNIVCGNNVYCVDKTIYAQSLGTSKVYLEFDTFGKSFEFDVTVKEIPIHEITCDYNFDTLYVAKGDIFNLDINVIPSYATSKTVDIEVSGSSVIVSESNFVAVDYGESIVTFSKNDAILVVKVVVCEIPDKMVVTISSDFAYGCTGRAIVNFYKDETLIDSDYYLECYVDSEVVSSEDMFANFEIKHNTFSLDVIYDGYFVIKVISSKNPSLTFDISVNN